MPEVTINVVKNGPLILNGPVELRDSDGKTIPTEKRIALCRCGASTDKPFCDGAHSKVGFAAAARAVPESGDSTGH
ncbi:MAG: CDGSH iron-sulfur domain-containing protein [Verrucomicrobiota bacterium]